MNLHTVIRYLRLRPFAVDTEAGRTEERYRLALLSMVANLASRLVGMLVMVMSVSLTLPYLGAERFGAWMTVASFASILSFLDLGVGNALTNRVAHASTSGVDMILERTVSGGLGLLGVFSLCAAVILFGIAWFLPWASYIKVHSAAVAAEVRTTFMVFSVLFAVSMFSNGVARVMNGLQRSFEVYLLGIAGSLVGVMALLLCVRAQAGLPVLLLCSMGSSVLANLILLVVLLIRGQFSVVAWGAAIRSEAPHLIHLGWLFFLLQIGVMVSWGADSFLIASAHGAASVAFFSVTQRLMQFVSQPLAIMNAPLWAAYADADGRRDRAFVRRTFVRSIKLTLGFATIGAVLTVVLGRPIINLWTHGKVVPTEGLVTVMAIWLILDTGGTALGTLLNGLGIVRQQVYVVSAFIAVALPLKLWWAQSGGAFGVVAAGIIAYILTTVIGYGIVFRRDLIARMS